MTRLARGSVISLVIALAACGGHSGDDGVGDGDAGIDANNGPHTLRRILVTPTNPIVELDLNTTATQPFTVTAQYNDGTDEDVSLEVFWTVANPNVGTMTDNVLAIPAFPAVAAETSLVTAQYNGLEGQAQITVVAYRRTGTQQDFFFVLPYEDAGGPQTEPLEFTTDIPKLDVFFLMDSTGSMGGAISNLKSSLSTAGTGIIAQVQSSIADTQFGVGDYKDFPIPNYGSTGDQPFFLRQAITSSVTAAQTGVNALSASGGNDWPESVYEGIYQAATGDGLSGPSPTSVPANHTGVGGVGFRAGVMPVIIPIGDAVGHTPGEGASACDSTSPYAGATLTAAHTRAQTKAALDNICARVVGVAVSTFCDPSADYRDFATHTGARVPPAAWDVGTRPAGCAANQCCTGASGAGVAVDANGLCPLVFGVSSTGTGLGNQIVTGLQMLTRFATFDATSQKSGVTTDIYGNPLPGTFSTADFITAVTPVGSTVPAAPPVITPPTFDATTFFDVTPATLLQFDVVAFNNFIEPTNQAQIFRANITVLAGGCTPLDNRDVLILVPPNPIVVE